MAAFRRTYGQMAMFLAMFAILFQAFLPAAQAIPWERSGDGLPDVLIVCSAWGAKTVTIDMRQDGPAGTQRDDGADDTSTTCPICAVHFVKISLPGDDAIVLHAPVRLASVSLLPNAATPLGADAVRKRIIRAPPGTVS